LHFVGFMLCIRT